MLLSVKASQNNFYDILKPTGEIMHALVSIVGKWSLLPPTIGQLISLAFEQCVLRASSP